MVCKEMCSLSLTQLAFGAQWPDIRILLQDAGAMRCYAHSLSVFNTGYLTFSCVNMRWRSGRETFGLMRCVPGNFVEFICDTDKARARSVRCYMLSGNKPWSAITLRCAHSERERYSATCRVHDNGLALAEGISGAIRPDFWHNND